MKAVDHEGGVRAVVLNGPGVGAAHVAARPFYLEPLVLRE